MQTRGRLPKLSNFARMLLGEWRKLKLPTTGDQIIVGVSGGADSTSLLLALEELQKAEKIRVQVCAAHLDHGIRQGSRKDAAWVSNLAERLGFDSVIGRTKVAAEAKQNSENLEQAARTARYAFLERTAKRRHAKLVLTAHTMDDQAETVLLRLMRGSSGAGLSGMTEQRPLTTGSAITLVRPILWARRSQTEDYCRQRRTDYLHDEMNEDERFARVKIRKQLMPVMQTFNKRVVEALSRTATLLRDDGAVLFTSSGDLLQKAEQESANEAETKAPPLSVNVLAGAPPALRRRAIREWISKGRGGNTRRLEMVHLLAVERLVGGNQGGKVVELPNGYRVRRKRGYLEFEAESN